MSSAVNLPPAFANNMSAMLGKAYGDFVQALSEKSPVSLRVNSNKSSVMNGEHVPWCATGRYLQERPVFTLDPALHAGAYYVQEASSMFLEQALTQTTDLSNSLTVLDLCAAPGGKSTHLLSLLSRDSLLISNEVIRSRASILGENIQKWGHDNVVVTNNDPEDFQKLKGFFDVIVVDAPCSGEGLFRKDQDAMHEWSPENVELCSKRQRRILSDIWPSLKQDGILIYSTCTYNRLENEDNLKWANEQFDLAFIQLMINHEWKIDEVKEQHAIGYHFFPHHVQGEGFFISVMRKTGEENSVNQKTKRSNLPSLSTKTSTQIDEWIVDSSIKKFSQWKDNILMMPVTLHPKMDFISQQLHVVSAGTMIGEMKHNKIIPDHALALSLDVNKEYFNKLIATKDQALQYLRKETLQLSGNDRGFSLVMYDNLPLGWVNVLDNRINNMYPANWRIRMNS